MALLLLNKLCVMRAPNPSMHVLSVVDLMNFYPHFANSMFTVFEHQQKSSKKDFFEAIFIRLVRAVVGQFFQSLSEPLFVDCLKVVLKAISSDVATNRKLFGTCSLPIVSPCDKVLFRLYCSL